MEDYTKKFGTLGKYKGLEVRGIPQSSLDEVVAEDNRDFYWVITDKSCDHFTFGQGAYELGTMTKFGDLKLRDTAIFLGKKKKKTEEKKENSVFIEEENAALLEELLSGKNALVEELLAMGK